VKTPADEDILFLKIETFLEEYNNHQKLLDILNENGAHLHIKDGYGNSLLHIAAMKGNLSIMSFLLEKNMDINGLNKSGKTPLHFAAKHSNLEVSIFLLKNGADYTIRDDSGRTFLESASRDKRVILKNHVKKT